MTRLGKLNLNNIHWNDLENILNYLTYLTINCINKIRCLNSFYRQLIGLSSLKYCNITIEEYENRRAPLTIATNEFSPIEHLIINKDSHLDEIYALLSYFPKLRRLTLHDFTKSISKSNRLHSIALNYLIYLDLNVYYINFNQFQSMIQSLFPKLEVLHLTVHDIET